MRNAAPAMTSRGDWSPSPELTRSLAELLANIATRRRAAARAAADARDAASGPGHLLVTEGNGNPAEPEGK